MKFRLSRLKSLLLMFIFLGAFYSIYLCLRAQQNGNVELQVRTMNQIVSLLDLENMEQFKRKGKPSSIESSVFARSESLQNDLKSPTSKAIKEEQINKIKNLCPIETLKDWHDMQDEASCKQHTMSDSSCKYVTNVYKYDFEKHTCGEKEIVSICQYQKNLKRFQCDYHACGKDFDDEVLIHLMDKRSGIVRPIFKGFRSSDQLEANVLKYAIKTLKQGNEFMFLSCGFAGNNNNKTQLITLDKWITDSNKKSERIKQERSYVTKKLNINVILLDSVSRSHFYRSLKKTVNFLRQTDLHSNADVLDFELFQSIHGHTTENLFGLFNGKLLSTNYTDREKEMMKTDFQGLLKYVKKEGYKVLYQEDMCWQGTYGLNTDLGLFLEWEKFFNEFKKNSLIDNPGTLLSFCLEFLQ